DEGLPLLGQRVLREDRLDRALRFACTAIPSVDPSSERERVLLGDHGAERVLRFCLDSFDAHYPPERLPRGEVEPADRPAADAEVGLAAAFLAGTDDYVARVRRDRLEPGERL